LSLGRHLLSQIVHPLATPHAKAQLRSPKRWKIITDRNRLSLDVEPSEAQLQSSRNTQERDCVRFSNSGSPCVTIRLIRSGSTGLVIWPSISGECWV
jgi:hypothetical protein